MEFPGFLGNSEVKQGIQAAFAARRFPHALILQGEPGCGKRTLAGVLAQALVCRDRDHPPCGVCPACVRARAGSHPDIRIVEGSGVTRSLSVDAVKELTADAYRKPEEAEYNVYILLLGDRVLEPAQNKLLKLVEEPPPNTIFLFVCRSAGELLPTIRSRAQVFSLRPLSPEEAAQALVERQKVSPQKARELAELCGGNLGRMEEELSGGEAAQVLSLAVSLVQGMLESGGDGLLKAAVPLQKDRKLFRQVLERLFLIFRDACVLRLGGDKVLGGAPEEADKLGFLPRKKLMMLPELIEEFQQKLDRNANMTLLVTDFCARLRSGAGR